MRKIDKNYNEDKPKEEPKLDADGNPIEPPSDGLS